MCLECRIPVQDGVFCGNDCIEEFRNFRNAIVGTGPGRRRVTLVGIIRYAVVLAVLVAIIFGAAVALTGTTDTAVMGQRTGRMIRTLWPF